jgi:hypothetical protein
MPASDSRNRSPYAIEELTVAFHRSPLGAWWRWRTELALALALVSAFTWLWVLLGWWAWPLVILGGLALVLALLPWTRRFLLARFWALLTRHRLQRAFWELRLHTRAGLIPLIPWLTTTPVGTRAVVLVRAGMSFSDFEDQADAFATACGAREARVTPSARWSSVLVIDIIRRDALGPARVVSSPLADLPTAVPALEPAAPRAWPEPAWAAED